jgi:hypothetical protein
VFQPGRRFECWLRVSNASGKPQSDAVPDFRGIAIKLFDESVDDVPATSVGQDFVLMSHPTMPLGTVPLFRDAVYYSIESSPLLLVAKFLLTGKASVLKELKAGRATPASPLDIRYWSTTPYRFGADRAVKYSLLPTSAYRSSMPARLTEDYLGEAMQAHLQDREATFDFCVQFQQGGMPIEDAGVRWDEAQSPFVKLASVIIPMQRFRTAEREALGESLSFSPAHALPEHAPLGGINRARVGIYQQLSSFRHRRDGRVDVS